MTIEIRRADQSDLERWDDNVARSENGTVFHQLAALRMQAKHTGAEFHPLVGLKGQEVVGLFPVFELSKGPVSGVFSPPPYLWVPYGGPIMIHQPGVKRRKVDRRNKEFLTGCLDWLTDNGLGTYQQFTVAPGYDDMRPFTRTGATVSPAYTYTVDLDPGRDALLESFSRDARTNIRDAEESGYTIRVGGVTEIDWIIDQLQDRYHSQGLSFPDLSEFIVDLYEQPTLPDGTIRPYVCYDGSTRVGGMIIAESNGTTYRWLGGMKPVGGPDISVNDALDWAVMCDAIDRGVSTYDLVGAGVESINRYKSKFDPHLGVFYRVRAGSWGIKRLVEMYRTVDGFRSSFEPL